MCYNKQSTTSINLKTLQVTLSRLSHLNLNGKLRFMYKNFLHLDKFKKLQPNEVLCVVPEKLGYDCFIYNQKDLTQIKKGNHRLVRLYKYTRSNQLKLQRLRHYYKRYNTIYIPKNFPIDKHGFRPIPLKGVTFWLVSENSYLGGCKKLLKFPSHLRQFIDVVNIYPNFDGLRHWRRWGQINPTNRVYCESLKDFKLMIAHLEQTTLMSREVETVLNNQNTVSEQSKI